jgi:hypothetical protein
MPEDALKYGNDAISAAGQVRRAAVSQLWAACAQVKAQIESERPDVVMTLTPIGGGHVRIEARPRVLPERLRAVK